MSDNDGGAGGGGGGSWSHQAGFTNTSGPYLGSISGDPGAVVLTFDLSFPNISSAIYWTTASEIMIADEDGSNAEVLVSASLIDGAPSGVAVSVIGRKVYWGEDGGVDGGDRIMVADFEGSTVESVTLLTDGLTAPRSFAIDRATQDLYYVEDNEIWKVSTSGGSPQLVVGSSSLEGEVGDLAVDVVSRYLLWTITSGSEPLFVFRANISDPSTIKELVTEVIAEVNTEGVGVDPDIGTVYYADTDVSDSQDRGALRSVSVIGGSPTAVSTDTASGSGGDVAVNFFNGEVYWTVDRDSGDTLLLRYDGSTTTTLQTFASGDSDTPIDLAVGYRRDTSTETVAQTLRTP